MIDFRESTNPDLSRAAKLVQEARAILTWEEIGKRVLARLAAAGGVPTDQAWGMRAVVLAFRDQPGGSEAIARLFRQIGVEGWDGVPGAEGVSDMAPEARGAVLVALVDECRLAVAARAVELIALATGPAQPFEVPPAEPVG